MAYCSVPGCESCQRRESDRDLSFHRFPSDPLTRQAWTHQIQMLEEYIDPHFQITESTKVCGRHFTEDCKVTSLTGLKKLKKGSVPTVFTGCRPATRRPVQVQRQVVHICELNVLYVDMKHTGLHLKCPFVFRDPRSVQEMKATAPELEKATHSYKASEVLRDHDYSKKPLTAKEQLQAAQMELELEEKSRELKSEQLFLRRLQHEPEVIMFYTGFKDYSTLKAFYLALQPTPETIWKWSHALKLNTTEENTVDTGFNAQHLCLFDQLFLFLCFLRRGFLPVDMSKWFNVSEATVRSTCVTWCHYLFFTLGTLPIWPSRQAVDELMPPFFRTTFPKTRVVLDLTEIHIQMATCTVNSSRHKGSTTLKSLVGITPSGSVSLVSSVYAASMSDKDIIRESGVLNLLEPGDEVMADTSLEIKDLLDVIGVNLVIPTFLGPNGRLNQGDIIPTQHVGHLKIHIERAISRIKEYYIFDDLVPSALCGSVNQLWTVCALLTNFQGPLL